MGMIRVLELGRGRVPIFRYLKSEIEMVSNHAGTGHMFIAKLRILDCSFLLTLTEVFHKDTTCPRTSIQRSYPLVMSHSYGKWPIEIVDLSF